MKHLHIAAVVGMVLLCGLAVFQVLLALGKPLGKMAWGGRQRVLPSKLRLASALAVPILLWAAYVLAARAGVMPLFLPRGWIYGFTWFFAGYFGLNVLANFVSRSPREKWIMGPVSIIISATFLLTVFL